LLSAELGEKWVIAACLLGLGEVVAAQGQLAWAAQLWGAAEALRETSGTPLTPSEHADYEQEVDAARIHLGEKAFLAAWTEGRTLSPEHILTTQGQGALLPPEKRSTSPSPSPHGLTPRELEVLRVVAQGLTNEQVAERLVISPRTVDTHLTSIYSKIGVSSRSAATRYAIEHHLV
jgi:DNA-binding CsgD family transcriptional regulator